MSRKANVVDGFKVGDVILYRDLYPITFQTNYKQTSTNAYGKIVKVLKYGDKDFIVQTDSPYKNEEVVKRKNVLRLGREIDMIHYHKK